MSDIGGGGEPNTELHGFGPGVNTQKGKRCQALSFCVKMLSTVSGYKFLYLKIGLIAEVMFYLAGILGGDPGGDA